jgi:hypothetical protein
MAGVLFPPRCRAVLARPPWAVQPLLHRFFCSRFRSRRVDRMIRSAAGSGGMDKDLIAALARAAGLEKALAEFPGDVASAVEQALGNKSGIAFPEDPAAEPWPPMRAGTGL